MVLNSFSFQICRRGGGILLNVSSPIHFDVLKDFIFHLGPWFSSSCSYLKKRWVCSKWICIKMVWDKPCVTKTFIFSLSFSCWESQVSFSFSGWFQRWVRPERVPTYTTCVIEAGVGFYRDYAAPNSSLTMGDLTQPTHPLSRVGLENSGGKCLRWLTA